ncbi:muramoyltetrapeptide carboxypeptidase [Pseudoalteromonas sp. KS88]|uniref:S66 family peptidase n=1 Tax=Pseudoalteromonas sp. KS88 TaxID=2109918 RepID=UPI00108182B2|nr:S66 peptidase family protein [Pseudoalteromonas sp. KS88]TGE81210.1 muramoyltetrapeptide carboxypeptidase [Pseudoalteromonas sp. KS88]
MESIIFPAPLKGGDKIAICAFSSCVEKPYHVRLDAVIHGLKLRGYQVVEGECLRHLKSAKERADELTRFLQDDSIAAVMPPWGGELAMEILQYINFDAIKSYRPKWIVGFSDVSTFMCILTARCGWATLHTANLMQQHPDETDPHCLQVFDVLALNKGEQFEQLPAEYYQDKTINYATEPNALFNLTQPSQWRCLNYKDVRDIELTGRLFGGCLDSLNVLLATRYLDLHSFKQSYAQEGLVLYLENAELSPTAVARSLMALKLNGVFADINGIVLGRSALVKSPYQDIDYYDAIELALGKCIFPVIIDADIGHVAPNMSLVNGAFCTLKAKINKGLASEVSVTTSLK